MIVKALDSEVFVNSPATMMLALFVILVHPYS